MEQLLRTRGGFVVACCWLAFALDTANSDCVDDGLCALYKSYHYRTLDGTLRDETAIGCQTSWLAVPDGWELVGYSSDGQHVAAAYNWGTERIVHGESCYRCSTGTKLGSWASYHDWRTTTIGGKTVYVPDYCNGRILIRQQGELTCPRGEEAARLNNAVRLTCVACPAGHISDGGLNAVCRPPWAYAAQQVVLSPPTEITVDKTGDGIEGIVSIGFSAPALPVAYYEPGVMLEYAIDIRPNESSLDLQGTSFCQQNHWSSNTIGNETDFTAVLRYSDLNEDCLLDLSIKDMVERTGTVGVALIVTDENQTYQGTVQKWYFPLEIRLPASKESIHSTGVVIQGDAKVGDPTIYNAEWAALTLELYEPGFVTTKWLPMYEAGERCYLVLTLVDSAGLTLTPVRAWISQTRSSSGEIVHNLTDSIVLLGHGSMGKSQARLSVILQACVNCYIHVEGEISKERRLGDAADDKMIEARQLAPFTLRRTIHSVSITVAKALSENEELPTENPVLDDGNEEDSIAQFAVIVGAGSLASLLIASGLCIFILRLRAQLGEFKYKRAAMDEPEDARI